MSITVGFRTNHGRFMSAQPEQSGWVLVGDRMELLGWETFTMTDVGGGKVTLKTFHGRFVSAQPDGTVIGDRTIAQEWETWDLIDVGPSLVGFRSFHGKFLSSLPEMQQWRIVADRTQLLGWETFTKVDPPLPVIALPHLFDHSDEFKETTFLLENHHKITTWITIRIDGADGRVDGKTRIDNVQSEIGWTGGVQIILTDVWSQPIYYKSLSPPSTIPGKHYTRYATLNPGETQEKTWTAIYPGLGPRFADLGNVTIMHINETDGDPFDP